MRHPPARPPPPTRLPAPPLTRPPALPAVKHCVKVRTQRSYRDASGTVIVNGADLVTEVAPHVALRTLFYLQGAPPPELAADRCVAVTETVMRKITGLESTGPGTLAAEVAAPALADFRRRGSDGMARLLVLERCQDPGNLVRALLGAVLWTQWGLARRRPAV